MQISVDFIHFACDWRPHGYNLHATGGHLGTVYMRLAASRMQTLHALMASCMQSSQFFASTLQEQLFELKNEDAINKSDTRQMCLLRPVYSISTMHGSIQSRETVPLNKGTILWKYLMT
jgi:hypothetical protein